MPLFSVLFQLFSVQNSDLIPFITSFISIWLSAKILGGRLNIIFAIILGIMNRIVNTLLSVVLQPIPGALWFVLVIAIVGFFTSLFLISRFAQVSIGRAFLIFIFAGIINFIISFILRNAGVAIYIG